MHTCASCVRVGHKLIRSVCDLGGIHPCQCRCIDQSIPGHLVLSLGSTHPTSINSNLHLPLPLFKLPAAEARVASQVAPPFGQPHPAPVPPAATTALLLLALKQRRVAHIHLHPHLHESTFIRMYTTRQATNLPESQRLPTKSDIRTRPRPPSARGRRRRGAASRMLRMISVPSVPPTKAPRSSHALTSAFWK